METTQIVLVDPADCSASENTDPESRPDLAFLMASLEADGQKVPVLLAPDGERPGKYRYIDGHGRGYCLGKLGRKMQAIVLPAMLSETERIEVKFATNAIRRCLSLLEIGMDAARYIELAHASQKEAAVRLKVSDTTISRGLSCLRRLPPDIRAEVNRLGHSFASLIASLPSEAAMRQALAFATTAGPEGKKPTRDQLLRLVNELRGKKKAKAKKGKRLRLRLEDRRFEVELKPGDTPESLMEAFRAAAARLARHKDLPLEAVAAVLADKEPSAA